MSTLLCKRAGVKMGWNTEFTWKVLISRKTPLLLFKITELFFHYLEKNFFYEFGFMPSIFSGVDPVTVIFKWWCGQYSHPYRVQLKDTFMTQSRITHSLLQQKIKPFAMHHNLTHALHVSSIISTVCDHFYFFFNFEKAPPGQHKW